MMFRKCLCVKCLKHFWTLIPSWWCEECRKLEFKSKKGGE